MPGIIKYFRARWSADSGYKELFTLALPLVVSTGSWSVQHFVDRMFLTWYSPESIAAAMPAGMLNFNIMCIFLGTAGYVNAFAAQYFGAARPDRIGPVMWQGIYISLLAGIVHLALFPFSGDIFELIGHEPAVMREETVYFKMLLLGAAPAVAAAAISGFFTGIGKTSVVMWVTVLSTVFNLIFDYFLIFGKIGFPELGIKGAGIATSLSACFSVVLYFIVLSAPRYRGLYNSIRGWRFDPILFKRLLKFGFPSGVQFFIEITGFTFFLLFIGSLGTVSLAATNIAFNINTLAFMPMIGIGIAVSILVGQNLGAGNPERAEYSVFTGLHMTLLYMTTIAGLYFFAPEIFILPFERGSSDREFGAIKEIVLVLLKFIAVYSLVDGFNIIFANALRGAGDTKFVMLIISIVTLVFLLIPSYFVFFVFDLGVYAGWGVVTFYVIALGMAFFARFLSGKWKSMRVIEENLIIIPTSIPENPIAGR